MKRILAGLTFLLIFLFSSGIAYGESSYVLPYPSNMPGSLSYKIHLVYENVSKYWYFGDFGQFNYNLKLADKYLVEAKTLFEYRQYLLGSKALGKSSYYFKNILPAIVTAQDKNKDISQKGAILREAAQKHIETLEEISLKIPDTFVWQPEKSTPITLYLRKEIDNAINNRIINL